MHTLVEHKFRFVDYLIWVTFVGFIFIVSESLRTLEYVRAMHIYWLDAVYAYAFLGCFSVIVAILLSLLFKGAIRLVPLSRFINIEKILQGVLFALFFTVWMNIIRLLFVSSRVGLILPHPFYLLLIFFCIGCLLFVFWGEFFRRWMVDWVQRLRQVVFGLIALYVVFVCIYLMTFLDTNPVSPVTRIDSQKKLPNVIIIVLDSMVSRDMSLYGYHLPTTPNLERITKTWTVYENAHSAGTSTIGFMPTLLTGRYPYTDEWYSYGDWTKSKSGWMNLAKILKDVGYEPVYVQGGGYAPGNYHLQMGWDRKLSFGEFSYPGKERLSLKTDYINLLLRSILEIYIPYEWRNNVYDSNEVLNSIDEPSYRVITEYFKQKSVEENLLPFFVYLHMLRPHSPYLANEFMGAYLPIDGGYATMQSQKPFYLYGGPIPAEQQQIYKKIRLRYDENIRKADEQVGNLMEDLRRFDLYDQSLIIVTADHGISFERGTFGYGTSLLVSDEEHIPLLIKYPTQVNGKQDKRLVSNIDIMPTVLDVVGLSYPADSVDGESLLNTVDENDQRVIYVRRPNEVGSTPKVFAALTEGMRLVQREDGQVLEVLNKEKNIYEQVDINGRMDALPLKRALEQFEQRMIFIRSNDGIAKAPPLIDRITH